MDEFSDFDRPVFKRLSHNDTGAATGHQAGIVIPKELSQYFPNLAAKAAKTAAPTVDENIRAILFIGNAKVGDVQARYQFQTWGGTRSPERRLTHSLAPLRDHASADDFLIIQRSAGDPSLYRLRLVKSGHTDFKRIAAAAGTRRWGPLYLSDTPVPEDEFENAVKEQEHRQLEPLQLFDNTAALLETRVKRIARARAFQHILMELYGRKCAVCRGGFHTPKGLSEVEAAHLVPRGLKGADDARNGLALCRAHHWAFDKGLFGILPNSTIYVPPNVLLIPQNTRLADLEGVAISPPSSPLFQPSVDAVNWHMGNVVNQWV